MNVLILDLKTPDLYMSVLRNALPADAQIDIITGSHVERYSYIQAPAHDPNSLVSRMKCWVAFYRFVMQWAKQNQKQYDCIFATSNPPINGYLGVKLKKLLHAPFVYMNWDLYPQVIEQSMHGLVAKIFSACWHCMNNRVYPQIDRMLTIGAVMGETLNAPLKKKIPVDIVPMYTDICRLQPRPKEENPFVIENGWTDKTIVLFSGKMGLGHNLEILLEASRKLRNHSDLLFVLIGHGQKFALVEDWIAKEQAENVVLLPLQSEEVFPYSMACGDIGFISQEKEMAKTFMPAKTYDMMACGMAILAYAEGGDDLSRLVQENHIGQVITKNNADLLARLIEELYRNPEKRRQYGENGRQLAIERFDRQAVSAEYRRVFERVVSFCEDRDGSP